jgi:trans-2-enoyl-CoA reductase
MIKLIHGASEDIPILVNHNTEFYVNMKKTKMQNDVYAHENEQLDWVFEKYFPYLHSLRNNQNKSIKFGYWIIEIMKQSETYKLLDDLTINNILSLNDIIGNVPPIIYIKDLKFFIDQEIEIAKWISELEMIST